MPNPSQSPHRALKQPRHFQPGLRQPKSYVQAASMSAIGPNTKGLTYIGRGRRAMGLVPPRGRTDSDLGGRKKAIAKFREYLAANEALLHETPHIPVP